MSGSDTIRTDSRQPETKKFKAEVAQVLNIVIHSLYTHREIFIRELVSNASDALEKMRREALVARDIADRDAPLEIRITADKDAHTLTVADTGIGMTREELESNLGTIARSGTREFLERLDDSAKQGAELIGKFGVGFYSAFMAGDMVTVRSRSFRPNAKGYVWSSCGAGEYSIAEENDIPRGAAVTVSLRGDAREFENPEEVKRIVRKYSNFVPFPIFVNGERVNTIQAVWEKSPSEVTDEEHREFFKFIANSDEDPFYRLHISSDAPMQFSALLYVPATNLEYMGFFRMKPMVNLYSRKVLIVQHAEEIMPEYLRFIAGAVDSADLPLNISRETLQDNLVFRKLRKFLAKRIIRHLSDEAKKDSGRYATFWNTFGTFIKEGTVSDPENRSDLAALLRFQSSAETSGTPVSLDSYVVRMREDQKSVFYLSGRSREDIERGPYISSFRKRGIEVLYLLDPIDDFVMTSLGEYNGKKLVSADSAGVDLPPVPESEGGAPEKAPADMEGFLVWMKEVLGDSVKDVIASKRAIDRPAIIVNPDDGVTTSMRRILKASGRDMNLHGDKVLEVNTGHPLILSIKRLRDGDFEKGFLQTCVRQVFDNAQAEAGLLDDTGSMVDRIYEIMTRALTQ